MTLYLTDQTDAAEIQLAAASHFVHAVKLYPAGATTNSDAGRGATGGLYPTLAAMEEADLPLLVHGEVTDPDIDIFDREKVFIDRHLAPIAAAVSADCASCWSTSPPAMRWNLCARPATKWRPPSPPITCCSIATTCWWAVFAPITSACPFSSAISTSRRCWKRRPRASPSFSWAPTPLPTAPPARKTAAAAPAYTRAHAAMELYAEVFEQMGALDKLEGFASHFGPDFYRLPRNTRHHHPAPRKLAGARAVAAGG